MDRLINENAVLSAIGEWIAHNEHTYTNATEYLRNRIKAIKTAKQEPTAKENLVVEDCISRQAVDRLAMRYLREPTDKHVAFYEEFIALPPVTPKPKSDVLDKIRAEIEQVKYIMNEEIINHDRKDLINFVNGLNQSLAIINKYKAESEGKK